MKSGLRCDLGERCGAMVAAATGVARDRRDRDS